MLKRLIEVALPLKEVSEQSAREKSIRHGHISTLHIWWARRPLAACRAVVFASLIPDPDDPECPPQFRKLVMEVLSRNEFKPKNGDGSTVDDTPRNRCLEFIKYLVRWENSNKPEYIEPARTLIAAAHKFLHPDAEGDAPKVLDPFAGGGAIPLEALRLGCEAHAIDLNPVAHLIELCTLVYPQKYGQPDSRPVPDYIKRLIAHNKAKKQAKDGAGLFDGKEGGEAAKGDDPMPNVEITEAEYRKNPLAADVKYWGHCVLEQARRQLAVFFPERNAGKTPVSYLWARTVKCSNPTCGMVIPLIQQGWLCQKPQRKVAIKITPEKSSNQCHFRIVDGKSFDFDPHAGTMQQGRALCPNCQTVVDGEHLRSESCAGRMGEQLIAVVLSSVSSHGKDYRVADAEDTGAFFRAKESLELLRRSHGPDIIPNEPMTPDRPSPNSRGLSGVVRYGIDNFGKMFNARQALAMATFVKALHDVPEQLDSDYGKAISTLIAMAIDRQANQTTTVCRMDVTRETLQGTYSRQALAMTWDYAEVNPIGDATGGFSGAIEWVHRVVCESVLNGDGTANCMHGSATALPFPDEALQAVITDPPYYDSVPYSDLSDFFYVWLKRSVGKFYPDRFRTPLTPKSQELIAYYGKGKRQVQKLPEWYEAGMAGAFAEMFRVLTKHGTACVMFAHKTSSAWETIITGLLKAGLQVMASWPIHTEMKTRMVARNAAALASSVTLICRKRIEAAGPGLWDDVGQELKAVAQERLDFFWNQGIRGADFFISAIGPALSVFGKYERVTKLSGEPVTVGQFLDEVRGLVTNYALSKILHTTQTSTIDQESQFYVVWKWSYVDAKVPADESFKLAQALRMSTETMWDRTGVLEKSGENVQAMPVAKRMKVKDLGEPNADGSPASLIDVLHRLCAFRDKGDTAGMAEFLARSGQAGNSSLWLVAQAISEILPDGEKEKQLMQGLLNQRDMLEEAARDKKLF